MLILFRTHTFQIISRLLEFDDGSLSLNIDTGALNSDVVLTQGALNLGSTS